LEIDYGVICMQSGERSQADATAGAANVPVAVGIDYFAGASTHRSLIFG
jgi:hypothetical protein